MSDYADQFSGASRTEDLETMLQLNYLKITKPRRDANLFRSFVTRSAEQVRNRQAMPEVRFAEARAQTVYGNHPRLLMTPRAEDFEALDLDRMVALNQARLSSAKGMTFFFVGDFDIETVKPLLATYVASLPVGDLPLQYHDPEIRQVADTIRKEFKAGVEQKSTVTYDFGGDLAWTKGESLVFRAMLDVLNIRITDELREKQKLIYSGGASGRYGKIPRGSYALSVQLPTSPQNVEKVEAALWSEIDKLQSAGPSEEDLNKVKQAMLQSYRKSIRENGYWLGYLVSAQVEDNDAHEILTVEQRINALTGPKVQAAAKRYLDKQKYVEMVLKPEA
jgi:zinc protease